MPEEFKTCINEGKVSGTLTASEGSSVINANNYLKLYKLYQEGSKCNYLKTTTNIPILPTTLKVLYLDNMQNIDNQDINSLPTHIEELHLIKTCGVRSLSYISPTIIKLHLNNFDECENHPITEAMAQDYCEQMTNPNQNFKLYWNGNLLEC